MPAASAGSGLAIFSFLPRIAFFPDCPPAFSTAFFPALPPDCPRAFPALSTMNGFLSLARKWRPRRLADLAGHEYAAGVLRNAVLQNRMHHAFLFTGTRGVGKTTLARILAALFNCENPENGDPCQECALCKAVAAGSCMDVVEVDAASHTGVDDMREVLESAQYSPVQGKCRVFIIDEAHMLSKNAFNAMLKTLEEPPPHVKFVLATTEPEKLPPTIISRCLCFSLSPLPNTVIRERLAHILQSEGRECEPAALAEIARLARGSMRDALSILDQALAHAQDGGTVKAGDVRRLAGETDAATLRDILRAAAKADCKTAAEICARLAAENASADAVLCRLAAMAHKAALHAAIPEAAAADEDEEETAAARELAGIIPPERLQVLYEIFLRGRRQMPFAPDEQTGLEMTILRAALFAPADEETEPARATPSTVAPATPSTPTPLPSAASPQQSTVQPSDDSAQTVAAAESSQSPSSPESQQSPPAPPGWAELTAKLNEAARAITDNSLVKELTDKGVVLSLDKSCAAAAEHLRGHLISELRRLRGGDFNVKIEIAGGDGARGARNAEREERARKQPAAAVFLQMPGARLLHEGEEKQP